MNIKKISQKLNAYERLMRLDKPIGILLLLMPTLWAIVIAFHGKPNWGVVILFITGTVLMRSAGCVMNDIADSKLDGAVERTKNRPLVTGEVSKKEALLLAGSLSVIAFGLVCFFNRLTIQLSVIALLVAASYPLSKRFISIPQAYLGIAFGFGILMAFSAILGYIPFIAWILWLANVFWAIAYDTEYAMVDRSDDLKVGIKSSAITFGRFDVLAIMICYALALCLLAWAGYQLHLSYIYYLSLMGAAAIATYHYFLIRTREKNKCFKAFLGNSWFGFTVFAGLCANYWMKAY